MQSRRVLSPEIRLRYRDVREKYESLLEFKKTAQYARWVDSRKRERRTIVFLISMPEIWNSLKSIYAAAVARGDLDVHVIAHPKLATNGLPLDNPAYAFLCGQCAGSLISAYDEAEDRWFLPESLAPDCIVYARPYRCEYHPSYQPDAVRTYAKVYLVPYAYNMLESSVIYQVHNSSFLRNCRMVFVPNLSRLQLCRKLFSSAVHLGYLKLFYCGFPRHDLLPIRRDAVGNSDAPIRRILWLPRWTTEIQRDNEISHFLDYCDPLLQFFEVRPSMELMIRPHPLMFDNFVKTGWMTRADIDAFFDRVRDIPNVCLDDDRDYASAFDWSDALIADYTSLLMEYYIVGKPIVLCGRPRNLSAEGCWIDETIEHADDWGDIEAVLLGFSRGECVQPDRSAVLKKILPIEVGGIGRAILYRILEDKREKKFK